MSWFIQLYFPSGVHYIVLKDGISVNESKQSWTVLRYYPELPEEEEEEEEGGGEGGGGELPEEEEGGGGGEG
jgi:hypothetical protein